MWNSVYGGEYWKATYTGLPPTFLTVHVLHNVPNPQKYLPFEKVLFSSMKTFKLCSILIVQFRMTNLLKL
jgi:hypothetical protein